MNVYTVTYTDTFGGEPNFSWVRRATVTMPDITYYGYDGMYGYARANRAYNRELMRRAKAAVGLTGVRGVREKYSDIIEFRPYGCAAVLIIEPDYLRE